MDRRDFIKASAAAGATVTLAGCGNPETQLIRFIPEEPLFPGIATWKPSVCSLCSAGCGLQVRVMDGEAEVIRNGQPGILKMGLAKKLEGNSKHPISQGRLCVRGQAAIQTTYHPDRIRHPLRRTGDRGLGPFQEISWDDAMTEVLSRLNSLVSANNPKSLGFLTRPLRGQREVLVSQFLQRLGASPATTFEVFDEDVLRKANGHSFGYTQLPTFDLARSRYVLSFGADFLGTWNSPVSHSVAYGEMRQGRPGVRAKFVQVEPRMSQTGANADEWVPAKPGTEGVLALGIAHVLMQTKLRAPASAGRAGELIEGWNSGLPSFTPQEVEKQTGVTAARVERLAREFAENGPALAIIGGAPLAYTNGMFQALAVNALNALIGSVEQPGGLFFTPQPEMGVSSDKSGRPVRDVAAEILSATTSPVQLLFLNDTNPVFGSPGAWRVEEALRKVPYIVSFGSFLDETSMLADLILPDHSFLESWVDDIPEAGSQLSVASVAPPTMRPLHQTRSMPDVLLELGQRLQRPLSLPWKSYEEMLKGAFESLGGKSGSWLTIQQQGGWWSDTSSRPSRQTTAISPRQARPAVEAQFEGRPEDYPFHFLPYASQAFLDGSLAHLPWLQELPDTISTAMWSSWIEINPKTAASLGITQGDVVEVASTQGTLQVPVLISPGIAPDVVAMPVGQGHRTFTRYASGRGANPLSILSGMTEPETGVWAWAATRVRIAKATSVSDTNQLILFSNGLKEEERHR
jgi:anaerobic selenocysteine-containing dehydrogenase